MSDERTSDEALAARVQRAAETPGRGAEAFTAVLEAVLAAGDADPRVLTPLLWRLWFTPWRIDPGERVLAREAAWLAGTQQVRLAAGGADLSGFAAGSGETVLLVHGWGDYAARLGAFVEPLTQRGLRVVGVDLPAHGGNPDGRVDLYLMADAIAAVVGEEDVRAVVAHSFGAHALVNALERAPGLRAVALLAPSASLESNLRTFLRLFALPAAAAAVLRAEIDRVYGEAVWAETDAAAIAARLDVPALVVHSRDDDQVSADDVEALVTAWPGAQRQRVDGLGHTRLVRDPAVLDAVADFIADRVVQESREHVAT